MFCGACQREVHPAIEGDMGLRMTYVCPCGAYLGEVPNWRTTSQNTTATSVPVSVPPAMGRNPGIQLPTRLAPGPTVPLTLEKPEAQSVIEQIQGRLAYLQDGHIEMEIAERKMLCRMISASERKTRSPMKSSSNVVPFAQQKATK